MRIEELEKLVREGSTPSFADCKDKMNISITDFNAAVSKFERMRLIDLGIVKAEVKPISRTTWKSLTPEEQANFSKLGGTFTEDQDDPNTVQVVKSRAGSEMPRSEWEQLDGISRSDFCLDRGQWAEAA